MKKAVIVILCMAISTVTIACGRSSTYMDINNNRKEEIMNANVGIRERVQILEELGLDKLSEEKIKELEDSWKQMPEEVAESYDMTAYILSGMGMGRYNQEDYTWTPISKSVYSFDVEADDIGTMYTDVLQGISAISKEEFEITEVKEDISQLNEETGAGKHLISFNYNGHPYTFEGKGDYDWTDLGIIDFMNQVFEKENNPKRLLVMTDGYQICILFYNTKEWAEQFKASTGQELE